MKNKTIASLLIFSVMLMVLLAACSNANGDSAAQEKFNDPYPYCAAVGQIDAPDGRYTGPAITDALFADYLKSAGLEAPTDNPDAFKQMTIWRCMDAHVYVCNFGANIPCDSKANTDKNPTQAMVEFCQQYPDQAFIPMSVTGHNVIYSWHCVQDKPEILEQIDTVDAAGFRVEFLAAGGTQPVEVLSPTW